MLTFDRRLGGGGHHPACCSRRVAKAEERCGAWLEARQGVGGCCAAKGRCGAWRQIKEGGGGDDDDDEDDEGDDEEGGEEGGCRKCTMFLDPVFDQLQAARYLN
jgi:hypothetical protein